MGDDEPVKLEKLPYSRSTTGEMTPLGCMDIETSRGLVHVHDAPGFLTLLIRRPGIANSVGILLYQDDPRGASGGAGLCAQLDPTTARDIAASLLRLASEADGGSGRQ